MVRCIRSRSYAFALIALLIAPAAAADPNPSPHGEGKAAPSPNAPSGAVPQAAPGDSSPAGAGGQSPAVQSAAAAMQGTGSSAAADPRVVEADRMLDGVANSADRVHRKLIDRRASASPDAVRCLDDFLTRLHVTERSGRTMRDALVDAIAASDALSTQSEIVRLSWLARRAQELSAAASRCGLSELSPLESDGSTRVRVLAPPLPEPSDPTSPSDRLP